MPPQFLVVGHVVQDLVSGAQAGARPGGWRLGGTASFASLLAARLGLRAAVLTSASRELDLSALLPGVEVACSPAERSTQIENTYAGPRRLQYIRSRALTITPDMLPPHWRDVAIVLLGPVAGEVDAALAACFPGALLGISAQGWLRQVGPDFRVRPRPPRSWDAAPLLQSAAALLLSAEDLPPEETRATLEAWCGLVPALAFTRGEEGADVCYRGEWRHIDAFPAAAVDPTGAGDAFAAALLIRLQESGDIWEAARFAAAAASFVVEGEGVANIPGRQQIEARLAERPDIVCR